MNRIVLTITGDEAVEAALAILAAMKQYTNEEKVNELINNIQTLCDQLADVNTKVIYDHNLNQHSKDLNKHFLYFKKIVECNLCSTNAELKAAAEKANAVLAANKNIANLGRVKKSGAVIAFLKDLEEPEMKAAAEKLPGLADCITGIEQACTTLSTELRSNINDEVAANAVKPSVVKKELLTVINEQLLVMLAASSITDPDKFQKELDDVEGIISKFNAIAHSRQIKRKSAANAAE